MKKIKSLFALLLPLTIGSLSNAQDWPDVNHFTAENSKLGDPLPGEKRIVFMGNSITECWSKLHPDFFNGKPYINRGISGQTTPQMLIRFRPDVIKLKPAVVVILAGTNDIAGNTGPTTPEMIAGNIISMAELAKANDIIVVFCSVLPVFDYSWKHGLQPAEKIIALNNMLKEYADKNGIIYADFFSPMADDQKGMIKEYTYDGVHPNIAGYKVMEPIVEEAIKKALKKE
jgi:lysophospholipase L1-like esterase